MSVMSEHITYEICRNNGDIMESGLDLPTVISHFKVYDSSKYFVHTHREWVKATPVPFYRHRGPFGALWAKLSRKSDPWWEPQP